jgi:carbon monoxide dehydrogenase subunit G
MNLAGAMALPASPAAVRAVLRDPERLVDALPHVDAMGADVDRDGSFRVVIRPAIALGEIPVRTRWRPVAGAGGPQAIAYAIEGRTDEHWLALDAELTLRPAAEDDEGGEGGTVAEWTVALRTTGTIRSAGQRVLGAVVRAQVGLVLGAVGGLAQAADDAPAVAGT